METISDFYDVVIHGKSHRADELGSMLDEIRRIAGIATADEIWHRACDFLQSSIRLHRESGEDTYFIKPFERILDTLQREVI